MTVQPFTKGANLEGKNALKAFVEHYKCFMRVPFPNPFDETKGSWVWGADIWPMMGRFIKRESMPLVHSRKKDLPEFAKIDSPSLEFIQAMLMHLYITADTPKPGYLHRSLQILIMLEHSLRLRSPSKIADFSSVSVVDLNNSCVLAKEVGAESSFIYTQSVLQIMGQLGIIKSQAVLQWVNPLATKKFKRQYQNEVETLLTNNSYKLPNFSAVMALADYFRNQPWLTLGDKPEDLDSDFKNVIVSSILTIMMLVPSRSQELTEQLSVNCLVSREVDGTTVWGIDWYASKTDMNHIKWVPYTVNGEFESAVKEAIERIRFVTEPARQVFRSWDQQCSEFDPVAYAEAQREGWLPKGWPIYSKENGVRYSDALMVQLKYQTTPRRHTIENRAIQITKYNFRDWLRTSNTKINSWTGERITSMGFFDRIGHSGLELDPDDYNTHSYRHMVNTAARLGGMSEFDVNWWSHRRSMGEVYDHRSREHKRNIITTGQYETKELSPQERLDQINHQLPMTRRNLGLRFEIVPNATGGFTFQHPLGTCTHNYSQGPCPYNVNCLECVENAHCKGDKRTLKNLMDALDEVTQKIELATCNNDDFGLRRLNIRHEIVNALVDILGHESPLEDGAIVMLTHEQSPVAGISERAKALAHQIEHASNSIRIKHEDAIKQLGLSRILPTLDDVSKKKSISEEIQFDSFLREFSEDDEE